MFKIIVVIKVICYTPYTEAVMKNGETDILYTNNKQYEDFAEITTADEGVFKLPINLENYDYWLQACMGMTINSDKLGIFHNEKHEIERVARTMVGTIRIGKPEEKGIVKFCILPHAGVYNLDMETPNAKNILAILKTSEKEQKKVRIYFKEFPKGGEIFYVEFEKEKEKTRFEIKQLMLKKAIEIAENAFGDKKDKAGKPYLGHLERVMKGVENETEEIKVVAILHDLLEDCPEWSKEKLLEFFPETVVQAIVCMTHQANQSYDDYISQIQTNEWATVVKISDLKDNMDITRLAILSEKDIERIKKYHFAYWRLVNAQNTMEKTFVILAIQAVYGSDFGKKHLTDNEYISIPYPVVEGDKQFVVFTFFKRDGVRPDSKQRIYLPRYEVKIAFPSKEISIKELKTNVYQFKLYGEYHAIGNVKILENHAIQTVLTAKKEYQTLVSEILEKGYLLTNTNDAIQKEIATKIKHDLAILQEKDLAKYDNKNQKCLMDWVNRVLE